MVMAIVVYGGFTYLLLELMGKLSGRRFDSVACLLLVWCWGALGFFSWLCRSFDEAGIITACGAGLGMALWVAVERVVYQKQW